MNHELTEDPGAAAEIQNLFEIGQLSNITEFLQADIDLDGKPPMLSVSATIVDKPRKKLGEEQRA